MLRKFMLGALASAAIAVSSVALAQAPSGTAAEAKAMLEKAVAAVKADKAKALAMFQNGEGGFKDRDLYAFCANAGDGAFTAHPTLVGKKLQDLADKAGKVFGAEIMKVAAEGKVAEVSYMWPRPGADTAPVEKVTFVTKAGDQICGVGYYK